MPFLKQFHAWLTKWKNGADMVGLTRQTFAALEQTTRSYILLADYLIDVKGFDYILTGHILSDYLEGRFSWFRQLHGGNNHISSLQAMQAEKRIRIRSLIDMDFSLAEIKDIFADCTRSNSRLLEENIKSVMSEIDDFQFDAVLSESDRNICHFVAGYVAKKLLANCDGCSAMLTNGRMEKTPQIANESDSTLEELESKEEFLRFMSRGGLMKPSVLIDRICCYARSLFMRLTDNDETKKIFLATINPRNVYVEVFIRKLEGSVQTRALITSKCKMNHTLQDHHLQRIGTTMFHLFSKNLISNINSTIHASRKRVAYTNTSNAKKVQKFLKSK